MKKMDQNANAGTGDLAFRGLYRAGAVAALGFVGTAVYLASNQAFTLLSLSQQYAAATGETQRAITLAAGQAALAIHLNASYAGTGVYLSFLLVSAAGLLISLTMWSSPVFNKGTAVMGILANGFQLSYYIVLVFAPAFVFIPISISAVFLLIWYMLVGVRLWALGGSKNSPGCSPRHRPGLNLPTR